MSHTPNTPRFQAGTIVTTLGARQVATLEQIAAILRRHVAGDWGEVDKEDARANEHALKHGERVMSVYDVNGEKLWVLTEANRAVTTVLTPSEY